MSDIANNVIRSNKHWRHIALTFMCMLMLILSFCLVVNAENGETNTEEVAGNETAVQSEQSENVSEPQNETNSEEATQATDYSHETRSAAYAAGNEAVSETPVAGVWKKEVGGWRFYNKSGAIQRGFCYIEGKKYYFGPNDGLMKTGWQIINRSYYYFGAADDGAMKTGWEKIGGYWYYFENNHILVSDAVKQIDGHTYVFNADGVMQANEFTFKGKRYFADASGAVIEINEINDVIKYGLKFLGENGNRFNDWYYNGNTKYRSLAWCNTFVSYVMSKCGINFKSTAYVPHAEQWMHSNYRWVDYKDAKAGDVIIFCWSGKGNNSGSGNRDHIGFLISKNPDGTFTTLEGNTSGGIVAIRTRYAKNIRNIFNPRR